MNQLFGLQHRSRTDPMIQEMEYTFDKEIVLDSSRSDTL